MRLLMKYYLLLLSALLILSLSPLMAQESRVYPFAINIHSDRILSKVIEPPKGYARIPEAKLTDFQYWVSNFPMMLPLYPVTLWDGQKLFGPDSTNGIINFGIGTPEQRDADVPIMMVSEYLRVKDSVRNFPFLVRETDSMIYDRFLSGQYALNSTRKLIYIPGAQRDSSAAEFYRFLQLVMNYTSNRSLLNNLVAIEEKDIVPGTFYVQLKNPAPDTVGHTAVILDVCYDPAGDMKVLAGWGGDPAHLFYIARPLPPNDKQWFSVPELKEFLKQYGEGKFYRYKM
jgi:hypothetical protein